MGNQSEQQKVGKVCEKVPAGGKVRHVVKACVKCARSVRVCGVGVGVKGVRVCKVPFRWCVWGGVGGSRQTRTAVCVCGEMGRWGGGCVGWGGKAVRWEQGVLKGCG